MVVSSALSGGRSAKFREDVAYLGFGGIGRADRIDWAASLHSRPRSRAAGYVGRRSSPPIRRLQSPGRRAIRATSKLLTTNKHEQTRMTISSCPKANTPNWSGNESPYEFVLICVFSWLSGDKFRCRTEIKGVF